MTPAMIETTGDSLNMAVHIIQISLTPIFLLTAVANLLSVFTTRLARVADQVSVLTERFGRPDESADTALMVRLVVLRRRSLLLDGAVILAAISGACTCCTVLTLFLGVLRSAATRTILLGFFGLAILSTIGALAAFLFEVLLASQAIRETVDAKAQRMEF